MAEKTVTIVVRTPFEGDAGDFFIEGAWLNKDEVFYSKRKGYCYDVLEIPIKECK